MTVKFYDDDEAAKPVEVEGTGLAFMAGGVMIRAGDRVHVPAPVARMLVERGRAKIVSRKD